VQRADDAELALDRVRRGQQLARRLAAQRIVPSRRGDAVGRVRLSAAELLDLERAANPSMRGRR